MKKRGLGIASMFYGTDRGLNRPEIEVANVEIDEQGAVTLFTAVHDRDEEITTRLAHIVGAELGMPAQDIQVVDADTGSTADSRPTFASRAALVPEQAVRHATLEVRLQLVETAAPMLRVSPGDLDVALGAVRSRRTPQKRVSVAKIVGEMHKRGQRCLGWGWQAITTQDVDPCTSQGEAYQRFGWTTQLAEVEVDMETGFVKVTRLVSVTDGGSAMGPLDMPAIQCLSAAAPDPSESDDSAASGWATVPTTSAVLNAIYDAVGVRVTDESAIAEQLFLLLHGAA
jgi:nicotinate dehydrogenase medium molybdopterin subunit